MSQRNPLNDRYQADDKKGQTRKSAATAKPKTKAASSVRIQSTTKTPQQKKAAAKAKRQETATIERKYYNPPTAEYKKWKKIWWMLIASAVVMTAASFTLNFMAPDNQVLSMSVLGIGYVGLIGSLIVDFSKVRKIRRQYQAEMQAKATKEARAIAKQEHAAAVAAKKTAASEKEEGGELEAPAKKGILSFINLGRWPQRVAQANKAFAGKDDAAKDSAAKDSAAKGGAGKKAAAEPEAPEVPEAAETDKEKLILEVLEEALEEPAPKTGKAKKQKA